MSPRVLVLWCPDWSVAAALAEEELPRSAAAAVLSRNLVTVCNETARQEGVRRGMRRRDAQARCPELLLLTANPERDARSFETVLTVIEQLRPGVAPLRPGLLAVRAPGRFYGGEPYAAAHLAQAVVEAGVWDVRIGIADDLFTAEQAARRAAIQEHLVVPPGRSADFLRDLPVEALLVDPEATEMVSLLQRLGLRTLGQLAALPAAEVGQRFGGLGARIRRRLTGQDTGLPAPRQPPPELTAGIAFEPPLESVEAVCFSVRTTAERFIRGLDAHHLVATQVRVEARCAGPRGEDVVASTRPWLHPRHFGARDLVDRVHWQLQGQWQGSVRSRRHRGIPVEPVGGPITGVRFVPEVVEPASAHAEGLWGGGGDELVERGMARVQSMLGYDAVLVPAVQGGRSPAARQAFVPWGERAVGLRPLDRPWPGRIPGPAPVQVFGDPVPSQVHDATGQQVRVSDRGWVTGEPAAFQAPGGQGDWLPVESWAGPWPADEVWWEQPATPPHRAGPAWRFQLVTVDGRAWLMSCSDRWWVEAGYD